MLEIFALPYFAVSGVIGWVIFEPFFRNDESESLARADLAITDLLAISLPISVLFASVTWMMPARIRSLEVQAVVITSGLLFAAVALTLGLILVPRTFHLTFLKRMAIVGVIAPLGILLTIGWVGFLIWSWSYSILYLAPSSMAIAAAIAGLRILGVWVCQRESTIVETANHRPT